MATSLSGKFMTRDSLSEGYRAFINLMEDMGNKNDSYLDYLSLAQDNKGGAEFPTAFLRYLEDKHTLLRKLQQKWVKVNGDYEWRDIPTVTN